MNIKVNNQFFELEKLRDILAKKNRYKDFRKTYLRNVNIRDVNNNKFWNERIKNTRNNISSSPIYKDKINIVTSYLANKMGKLLDIGIGYADVESVLYGKSRLKLYGIDISNEAVKYARDRYIGEYFVSSVYKTKFKNNFFDYITCLDVLEHLPAEKVFKAYSEIFRILRPGGQLIISVPLNEGLDMLLKKGINPNGHVRVYTSSILNTELRLNNFRITKCFTLYAFRDAYKFKKLLIKFVPFLKSRPNLYIVMATKK